MGGSFRFRLVISGCGRVAGINRSLRYCIYYDIPLLLISYFIDILQ